MLIQQDSGTETKPNYNNVDLSEVELVLPPRVRPINCLIRLGFRGLIQKLSIGAMRGSASKFPAGSRNRDQLNTFDKIDAVWWQSILLFIYLFI